MAKTPQNYIEEALREMEKEVKEILANHSLSLTEKDKLIYPYIKKRKVLQQAIEDLNYLDTREEVLDNTCKMGQFR